MCEEEDRLSGDGESVVNVGPSGIGKDIGICSVGECIDISRHHGEIFIEGTMRIWVFRKKEKIFANVPERDEREHHADREEYANPFSRFLGPDPFAEGEERHGGDKEDERLGADCAKGVREPFFREEFRNEHGDESAKKEEGDDQFAISLRMFPSSLNEGGGTYDEENNPNKEKDAAYEIEKRIGRVVVSPIHISDEGVFDEGKTECFGKCERKIAVIDFGREDRYGCGSRGEIFRMSDE